MNRSFCVYLLCALLCAALLAPTELKAIDCSYYTWWCYDCPLGYSICYDWIFYSYYVYWGGYLWYGTSCSYEPGPLCAGTVSCERVHVTVVTICGNEQYFIYDFNLCCT